MTDALATWCDPALGQTTADGDGDGDLCDVDCDDGDGAVGPSQTEQCNNGLDDDCDPATPDVPSTWFADDDHDGFGNPYLGVADCTQPAGFVANGDDCDDGEPAIHPGATETPGDGVDQDCDGYDLATTSTGTGTGTGAATGTGTGTGAATGTGTGTTGGGTPTGTTTPLTGIGPSSRSWEPAADTGAIRDIGCSCDGTGAPVGWLWLAPLASIRRRPSRAVRADGRRSS